MRWVGPLAAAVKTGCITVPSPQSFHALHEDDNGIVTSFGPLNERPYWINAGFFCLRRRIFDVLNEGDELVEAPFQRLIAQRQLGTFRHRGFWQPMDTLRDKHLLEKMWDNGAARWKVWDRDRPELSQALAAE